MDMPYRDSAFDLVLLLDGFEHIAFADPPKAFQEIRRVVQPGGTLIASIPNLAHLN
jgi:ubiquinone/menaquinone biosynthesis C-methylase UbiE